MKTLWVLNPNTTLAMTEASLAQVRGLLPPGFEARGITATQGPEVIASRATFAAAAAGLPALVTDHRPAGGLLLACFGDPGLEALRQAVAPQPVVGLAEAAVASAVAAGLRFAILTAGTDWVDMLAERVADFGATRWLTGVHALPVNGRQLAAEPGRYRAALRDAAQAAERGGAQALILGGAAFAGLGGWVQTRLPVVDAIEVATTDLLRKMHALPSAA